MKINLCFKDGKISKGRELLVKLFSSLNGYYEIVIKKKRALRSNQQNAGYWAVIIPHFQLLFLQEWNLMLSTDEVHYALKYRFLFDEIHSEKTGEIIKVVQRTSELNKVDFSAYIDRLGEFSLDYFNTPLPEIGYNDNF